MRDSMLFQQHETGFSEHFFTYIYLVDIWLRVRSSKYSVHCIYQKYRGAPNSIEVTKHAGENPPFTLMKISRNPTLDRNWGCWMRCKCDHVRYKYFANLTRKEGWTDIILNTFSWRKIFDKWDKSFVKTFVALKRAVLSSSLEAPRLSTFTTDAASKLDVLGHDGDTFGVDGAQVGVLEKPDKVSLTGLLESQDSWALESQVSLEVLGNFTHQTLEWQFPDQQLGALLVTSDFTESDGSRPVSVWFLHSTSGWRTLTSGLGSQLLSWSLSSGRFTCGLLCSCHRYDCKIE